MDFNSIQLTIFNNVSLLCDLQFLYLKNYNQISSYDTLYQQAMSIKELKCIIYRRLSLGNHRMIFCLYVLMTTRDQLIN